MTHRRSGVPAALLATLLASSGAVAGPPPDTAGLEPAYLGPRLLVERLGMVLFTADDGRHGRELWRTDRTVAGTRLVAELSRGRDDSPVGLVGGG